ncbi:hypothetical protein HP570_08210 [Brevibacillus sp. RS1.1]|uniref:hypothetical protein n=1 Tax=Brevibacillus sp. RS1.1 TaxID=2738982 RepID=UPI00156AE282|nr:hypothetical protein [Brevibacillus sp. RS1.1]NRR02205.1 hypothetical protein [Brevibacillus sp. RS1.1]
MGKLKKRLWVSILLLAIVVGGFYSLVKGNPPLDIGTRASSEDHKSVVVGMGNKGFCNALQGFIITDDFDNPGSKPYGFQNLEDVAIKTGTSPSAYFKKMDEGTATKNDEIYGLSVVHHGAIDRVHVKYSYFGMTFNEIGILQ